MTIILFFKTKSSETYECKLKTYQHQNHSYHHLVFFQCGIILYGLRSYRK